MNKIRYEVQYGVAFNVKTKTFDSLQEAEKFVEDHIFGDSRFCKVQKIEELDVKFSYANYWDLEKPASNQLFERGIISKAKYNQSKEENNEK